MRHQNQASGNYEPSVSNNTLLYTIYRHHHGLSHEQATMKVEASLACMSARRNAG